MINESETKKTAIASDKVLREMQAPEEFSKRVNLMGEVAVRIGAAQSADAIIHLLRQEARGIIPGECAFLSLMNDGQDTYDVACLCTPGEGLELKKSSFPVNEGVAGWVLQNNSVMSVNLNSLPVISTELEETFQTNGLTTIIAVPVKTHDAVIGVLGFGSREKNYSNDVDLWLMQLFAAQVALAFAGARSLQKTRKRVHQIELVNRIARNLTLTLDVNTMLESAARDIQQQFNYFDVMIFLLDYQTKEAELAAHAGRYYDFLPKGYRQKTNQGIIGWVAENGQYLLVNDVSKDPRYLAYTYQETSSELAVPVMLDGVAIGVLNIEASNVDAFDETDILVAQILCDQIGGAVKNARFFEEIKRVNERLLEQDHMKTEFVSIVSHDFRTPLSTIMLAAKSLLRDDNPSSARHKEYLAIIVDQARKLSMLAEDTLSIARIETGQLAYQFKIVNVEATIKDALAMAKMSSRHKVSSTVDINASFVRGDQNKLRQVLQNLISNAVKYSPAGGSITVRVELNPAALDEVVFSVADQGIGIPPDQTGRLFQKFSRVQVGKATEIRGTGLGLWICAEIIKVHGGRIWVENNPGEGSTFKFTVKRGEE
jgi:K+-sensing histidine kinase KdpD